jgi:phenylacetate-CoA ligase
MKTAVKAKRILTGKSSQTDFTKYLDKIQFNTPEELRTLQAVSLSELMRHAVDNIPFYKKFDGLMKLEPDTIFDDIRKIPVTYKEQYIKNRSDFIAKNIKVTVERCTSGTLGNKAAMLMDKETELSAPDEFFNKMVGMVPGMGRLILKADEHNPEANKVGGFDYKINPVKKVFRVDHRHMNNRKLGLIIDIMQKWKPEVIWGNTHGAYVISKYVKAHDIEVPSPKLVISGGQTLLPQYSEAIEGILSTKVYDRYGSIEAGNTANQCREQKGYHYVPIVHFIEILDKELNPVGEGETGDLYITTLTKRAMPIIRYYTGDMAVYTGKTCGCGCNFPVIEKIYGRRKEGIISPTGTYLSLTPLNHIMRQDKSIEDFQMIQTAPEKLLIKIIRAKGNEQGLLSKIKEDIISSLDYNMVIEFQRVKSIGQSAGGKMLRIIPFDRLDILGEELNESL